ncbi:Rab1B, RAB family GTPase [Pelomyxa schiedti]|nr:Rab1B, RAB family GTPase [Pelomyxa schiedti]
MKPEAVSSASSGGDEGKEATLIKMLLVGDQSVGKSSLLLRFVDDTFSKTPITVGVDFKTCQISLESQPITLQIWDTASQERFRTITRAFYRGAHGIILLFDITSEESFRNIHIWLEEIRANANPTVNIILVGHKSDKDAKRAVTTDEAQKYASSQALTYIEASSKTKINVDRVFTTIAGEILVARQAAVDSALHGGYTVIPVPLNTTTSEKNSKCC